jgi:MFS transporter, DHA3 family, macrolide efflux protein
MLKALRNRPIALLWSGQALSSIGDEIYRVALIWLAVGLIGANAGYLAAGQSAALLALSLFGGKWADRWNHRRTMISVDTLRGLIVLVPVVSSFFMPLSLPLLWGVALSLSALSAFFDPALQATLPQYSPNVETLQAATGLMSTTLRLARVAGPCVIGVLTAVMSTIHFFTIDSLTFAGSAFSIWWLRFYPEAHRGLGRRSLPSHEIGFRESVVAGFRAIQRSPAMTYAMFTKATGGGLWALAYGLGLALLVRKIAPNDVRAFGWVIGTYGIGNLASALVLGNLPRRQPRLLLYCGSVWMGLGFVFVGLAPNLTCMMLAAGFAAIGGPLNDLPFTDLIQLRYSIDELPMIFRLRMALETAATLVFMLAAPTLLHVFSPKTLVGLCGFLMLFFGWIGIMRYRAEPSNPLTVVEPAKGEIPLPSF